MAIVSEAGAIVVRGDGAARRVLLVTAKRNNREWIFPKGHIESGETPESAALREAREEAGITGRVLSHAGTLDFKLGADIVRVQYVLVAHERDVPSDEHRERVWLGVDDALARLSFDNARSLLREAWGRLPDRLDPTSLSRP